jgi:hypothetical protein
MKNPIEIVYDVTCSVFGEANVYYVRSGSEGRVIIYLGDVLVTSSNGRQHTITDVYISFKIGFRSNRVVNELSRLKMYRESVTIPELLCGYMHSHAEVCSHPSHYVEGMGLCTGSSNTPINRSSENLFKGRLSVDDEDWIKRYKMFLHTFRTYTTYESISGGPYIQMSQLSSTRAVTGNISNFTNARLSLDKLYFPRQADVSSFLDVVIKKKGYSVIYDNSLGLFKAEISKKALHKLTVAFPNIPNEGFYSPSTGFYLSRGDYDTYKRYSQDNNSYKGIRFKDKRLTFKVIDNVGQDFVPFIGGDLYKSINLHLTEKINEKYLNIQKANAKIGSS